MSKSQLERDIEIKESFCDLLNDVYPPVKIGYSTFTPAEILECCDPVAFAIGLVEHEDYLAEMENEWATYLDLKKQFSSIILPINK